MSRYTRPHRYIVLKLPSLELVAEVRLPRPTQVFIGLEPSTGASFFFQRTRNALLTVDIRTGRILHEFPLSGTQEWGYCVSFNSE